VKTTILVVIYGKKIAESKTLTCLSNISYSDYNLIIFNNGPKKIFEVANDDDILKKIKDKGIDIELQEDIDNIPLSTIYNLIIATNSMDRIILFDDDTNLSTSFFNEINTCDDADLILPVILPESTGEPFYPAFNGRVFNKGDLLEQSDKIFSIGSGLVIDRKLIMKFSSSYKDLFDERFALYGVDFSFFRRLNILRNNGIKINVKICSSLVHSLSRIDKKEDSIWREHERLWDVVLSIRCYEKNMIKFILSISILILKNLLPLRIDNLAIIFKGLINGIHPRSKKYYSGPKINKLSD
jgi:hypothetical protein